MLPRFLRGERELRAYRDELELLAEANGVVAVVAAGNGEVEAGSGKVKEAEVVALAVPQSCGDAAADLKERSP